MSTVTRLDLWARLEKARLVEGNLPEAGEASSPWFIRVMLGFAGWLGALFLLGFVGAAFAFVFRNASAAVFVGAGACAAAVAIFRSAPKSDFMAQFGLAVSFAGQALLLYGMSQWFREFGPRQFAWCFLLQEAALFVLVPNFLHRVICALGGSLAAIWLIMDAGLIAFAPAAITAAFLAVWLSEFRLERAGPLLRAGGYGIALAAMLTEIVHGGLWFGWLLRTGHAQPLDGAAVEWLGRGASALVLVAAVVALLRREGLALSSPQGRVGLAAALILGAASFKAPGVGPAAAVLIVGYANGNRVLAGLGIVALLGYLSHYYYSLDTTLLYKSGLLAATGAALLAARFVMQRWWQEEKEVAHA
jgi:uncharacterized protein DUF4401